MKKRFTSKNEGFSTVELLVTLFVAAAFLVAGYQLYNVIIKDGGLARSQSRAANIAYDYMQRYSATTTNPCVASTPLNNSVIGVTGLSAATVTVDITCPYAASTGVDNATSVSEVTVTVRYNNPQKTVQYATYVRK